MHKRFPFSPPGMETQPWKQYLLWSLGLGSVFSLTVFGCGIFSALGELYVPGTRKLLENARMLPFDTVVGIAMDAYLYLAAAMGIFVFLNYRYFYRESKSIYLMKRIGRPAELHLRCWSLPVLGAAALLAARTVLELVYYLVYRLLTPAGCL